MIMEPNGWGIWLEDLKTGKVYDLTQQSASITADPLFAAHRFNVIYSANKRGLNQIMSAERVFAYATDNGIAINLERIRLADAELRISDISGRLLYTAKARETILEYPITNPLPSVYFIHVNAQGESYNIKVIR